MEITFIIYWVLIMINESKVTRNNYFSWKRIRCVGDIIIIIILPKQYYQFIISQLNDIYYFVLKILYISNEIVGH